MLKDMITRYAAAAIAEDLLKSNMLTDMEFYGYIKPTRWQRFKYKLQNIGQRFKNILTIVSGGDIHKDCGY